MSRSSGMLWKGAKYLQAAPLVCYGMGAVFMVGSGKVWAW